MKVLIENYRGWDIRFDTSDESFYSENAPEDKSVKKVSFASAKKYIDDYIKENQAFKPVRVVLEPGAYGGNKSITLIGIRKDGLFVYEDSLGKKLTLSEYHEGRYIQENPHNDPIFERIENLEKERGIISEKIKEEENKLVRVTVKEIKKRILGIN